MSEPPPCSLLEEVGGHVLTVDMEDWYMEAPPSRWGRFAERVERDTGRVLDVLDRHGVRATFFVLGWLAERHPALVRGVAEAGHEVALHGMLHSPAYAMTRAAFAEDLRRCRDAVERAAGTPAVGYRAPYFSVGRRSQWALEAVRKAGLLYDASVFPVWHFRYGWPGASPAPHVRRLEAGDLAVLPVATWPALRGAVRLNLPFGGGAYLRLLPYDLVAAGVRWWARRGIPAVLYFHPWELDPDQPRMRGPAMFRLRHYLGLRCLEGKLERLLTDFRFTCAERLARAVLGRVRRRRAPT